MLQHPLPFMTSCLSNSFHKTHISSFHVSKAGQEPESLGEQVGVVGADEAPGRPVPTVRQSRRGRAGAFPGAACPSSRFPIS